jgi:hypothetical protein
VRSVSSVVNPSSAGHGVHRPVSQPTTIGTRPHPPAFAKRATAGEGRSAAKPPSSAWHGVHRSFRNRLCSSACLGHGVAKIAGGF